MEQYDDKMLVDSRWLEQENQLTLRVKQLTWESDRVLSVTLTSLDGSTLPPWHPGAHVDVHFEGSLVRQYSLCGDPHDLSSYRVAVLREEVSLGGSSYVHSKLRPGEQLHVTGPRNRFKLEPAKRYLLIAGGIGITPLLPMIRACETDGIEWQLLYGGRERKSMAFLDEVEAYGPKVQVFSEDRGELINFAETIGSIADGTDVYACGPEPMLAALEQVCEEHAYGSLHLERFKPKTQPAISSEAPPFEVVCQRSGITVSVPADRSILQQVSEAGLDVPSSCQEGICGTCETRVLEGIPDHRDSLLSPHEQAAGDVMMICVSRALSPRLVLDL